MDDLISRQALLESIERISVKGNVLDDDWIYRFIQEFPSAQTVDKDINVPINDIISRQAAIDAIHEDADWLAVQGSDWQEERMERDKSILMSLPSAQPDYDLSGYSDRLWKAAYERGKAEAQLTGRWIWDDEGYHCSECFYHAYGNTSEIMLGDFKFCPNCGAKMEEEDG